MDFIVIDKSKRLFLVKLSTVYFLVVHQLTSWVMTPGASISSSAWQMHRRASEPVALIVMSQCFNVDCKRCSRRVSRYVRYLPIVSFRNWILAWHSLGDFGCGHQEGIPSHTDAVKISPFQYVNSVRE